MRRGNRRANPLSTGPKMSGDPIRQGQRRLLRTGKIRGVDERQATPMDTRGLRGPGR